MNLYVGNLSREVTEDDLRQAFQAFGAIDSINIIKDKFSGLPRGFAFIEMPVQAEAEAAIAGLKGKELKGRSIDVNEARPREDRRSGGPHSPQGEGRRGSPGGR